MVWFESMEFNCSQTENIQFIPDEKYKIEYEMEDSFEKGCCYSCDLGRNTDSDEYCVPCILGRRYDECPLEEVEVIE